MIYFIVNSTSRTGKGLDIWKQVRTHLKSNNVEFKAFETKYAGHATELARKISSLPDEEITLVTIGGDGTVNEVINGIADFSKIRFGVIPTGSGNDFARGLGLSNDPILQTDVIMNSIITETIDIGKVWWEGCDKPRYFAISAGVGLDAIVCKKALTSKLKKFLNKIHLGKLTYIILTIQTLFSMDTAEVKATLDDGEEVEFKKLIFAAAMNFRAEGGGVPMAPRADAKDGLLSMCIVHGIPKWVTFFCLPFLVLAKHEWIPGFDIINCKRCEIRLDKPVVLHEDGEYCADTDHVVMECMPEKLRLIV